MRIEIGRGRRQQAYKKPYRQSCGIRTLHGTPRIVGHGRCDGSKVNWMIGPRVTRRIAQARSTLLTSVTIGGLFFARSTE